MRRPFTLLFSITIIYTTASAQTVCGTVGEGGTLTLTAPAGKIFNSIVFASYGTPVGSCGSFAIGGCNATSSTTIVSAALMGHNSGSIGANNGVFGDPCVGTGKLLAVEAGYTSALPLTLISFSAQKTTDGKIKLQWLTDDEINTADFVIEKSTDGTAFDAIGSVTAKGSSTNNYDFTALPSNNTITYYRLKMVDKDGRFTYSNSLRLNNTPPGAVALSVFPNPAKNAITISGLAGNGQIRLLDTKGKLLRLVNTTAQTLTLDISKYPQGLFVLQYTNGKQTVSQKLVKQ